MRTLGPQQRSADRFPVNEFFVGVTESGLMVTKLLKVRIAEQRLSRGPRKVCANQQPMLLEVSRRGIEAILVCHTQCWGGDLDPFAFWGFREGKELSRSHAKRA